MTVLTEANGAGYRARVTAGRQRLGPGMLVAAAFIGPGTLTTASVAGARFDFALAWTLVLAVCAAIALQEMALRVGVVTGTGLGEALTTLSTRSRLFFGALVAVALGVGNTAFQLGNVTGAALAVEGLTGLPRPAACALIGSAALALLWRPRYRRLERVLVLLVACMALLFAATAIAARPDAAALARGLALPSFPEGSGWVVLALIGTTVVPYNLFLHASSASTRWGGDPSTTRREGDARTRERLRTARTDSALSIALGGVLTLCVVATAAAAFPAGTELEGTAGLAEQLSPLLGAFAGPAFLVGLLAAGLTSAVTAPWAAGLALAGFVSGPETRRAAVARGVSIAVLSLGTLGAALGQRPIAWIVTAQATNALLLPLVVAALLVLANRKALLGEFVNGPRANLVGLGALVLCAVLAGRVVLRLIGGG